MSFDEADLCECRSPRFENLHRWKTRTEAVCLIVSDSSVPVVRMLIGQNGSSPCGENSLYFVRIGQSFGHPYPFLSSILDLFDVR